MKIKGLDSWVEKLGKTEMPVLANVVQELNELTGDDDTEVNQLADAILKDANLTSQVLRIANSVTYNPSSYPINTVSRAIVLIGFSGVRAICVSVMIIDSLLKKHPRERLLNQMAQSFHCAVQARALVRKTRDEVKEEVFIAGLLYHLAELAFWSTGGSYADEIERLVADGTMSLREATEEVLGCSFKAITRSLANVWSLGETLEQAVYPPSSPSPKVRAVCLAEEISQAALQGWESDAMKDVLQRVAKFTGQSFTEARKAAEEAAEEAATVALTYGAPQICPLIPSRRREELAVAEPDSPSKPQAMRSDPQLQLSVLRDLSHALQEKIDINSMFQMVLEGLHRGVGLERVVLAFVQKQRLQAKFVLGDGTEKWREQFAFSCASTDQNLFARATQDRNPLWWDADRLKREPELLDSSMRRVIGCYPCFVSGICLGKRCVALFYADRWESEAELQQEQFESFGHFMLQTEMSLRMISERR